MKKFFLLAVVITAITTLHKLNVQNSEAVRQLAGANVLSTNLYNLSKGDLQSAYRRLC